MLPCVYFKKSMFMVLLQFFHSTLILTNSDHFVHHSLELVQKVKLSISKRKTVQILFFSKKSRMVFCLSSHVRVMAPLDAVWPEKVTPNQPSAFYRWCRRSSSSPVSGLLSSAELSVCVLSKVSAGNSCLADSLCHPVLSCLLLLVFEHSQRLWQQESRTS